MAATTGTATGAWAWLNDLAAYDEKKNATLPFAVAAKKVATPVVAKPTTKKPTVVLDEAARQRVIAGMSRFGFGAFDTDRGRNDQKGASVAGIGVRKPVVLGSLDPLKPGGLTTNAGITAVGLPTSLATGKPIGTILR